MDQGAPRFIGTSQKDFMVLIFRGKAGMQVDTGGSGDKELFRANSFTIASGLNQAAIER